jgi:hypothetical protein
VLCSRQEFWRTLYIQYTNRFSLKVCTYITVGKTAWKKKNPSNPACHGHRISPPQVLWSRSSVQYIVYIYVVYSVYFRMHKRIRQLTSVIIISAYNLANQTYPETGQTVIFSTPCRYIIIIIIYSTSGSRQSTFRIIFILVNVVAKRKHILYLGSCRFVL